LEIVNPPAGATYSIDPTLRREFQSLPFRATTTAPGPIEWFVDGTPAGSAASQGSVDWPLAPGRHRITARDSAGRTTETTIDVR
jgi:membrane carboxypeptidase/penicillin-binding protein PbpC